MEITHSPRSNLSLEHAREIASITDIILVGSGDLSNTDRDVVQQKADANAAAAAAELLYALNNPSPVVSPGLADYLRQIGARRTHEREASFDSLTGLRNQNEFKFARKRAEADPAMQFIAFDVDALKAMNSSLHRTDGGDAVIYTVAQTLAAIVDGKEQTTAYRSGGDEMTVITAADPEQIVIAMYAAIGKAFAPDQTIRYETDEGITLCLSTNELLGLGVGVTAGHGPSYDRANTLLNLRKVVKRQLRS